MSEPEVLWEGEVEGAGLRMRLMPLGPFGRSERDRGSYWQIHADGKWWPAGDIDRQLAARHLARELRARDEALKELRAAARAVVKDLQGNGTCYWCNGFRGHRGNCTAGRLLALLPAAEPAAEVAP